MSEALCEDVQFLLEEGSGKIPLVTPGCHPRHPLSPSGQVNLFIAKRNFTRPPLSCRHAIYHFQTQKVPPSLMRTASRERHCPGDRGTVPHWCGALAHCLLLLSGPLQCRVRLAECWRPSETRSAVAALLTYSGSCEMGTVTCWGHERPLY